MLVENRLSPSVISADKWSIYQPEEATVPERKRRILTNLTFRIERGEKVLLTGPSGSGKSTFLHAVAGLDRYNGSHLREGKLKVSRERTVGLVQQDPEAALILGHVDVNVAFGPENCAVPHTQLRERVAGSLGTVGLQVAAGHKTEELSGGQKQRLAIAGVVAMEPELMLLDEPTAHLDPQGVIEVRDAALRAAARNNATLIVAEHRLTAWHGHVDRVVVLSRQGEIIADGPPGDVLDSHSEYLEKHGLWLPGYVPKVRKIVADRSLQVKSAVTLRTVGLGVSRAAGLPKSPATPWRRQRYRRKLSSIPPAVQGIDFSAGNQVPGRNIICVTGENGAGKTSFALTCANLLAAVAGEVTLQVGGTDAGLAMMPPEHLPGRVGMVLQEPEHQFVASSVADEIWHGLRKASAGSGAETFTEAQGRELYGFLVRHLSLEHCQDQNPYTLSGGEKRRLALAAVLAARPRVLVLDEPTAGQDNGTWRQIMGLCRGLAEAGIVLIVISHDELLRAELLRSGAAEYRFGERAGLPRHAPGGKGSDAAYYPDMEGRNNTCRDTMGKKPFLFLRSLNPLTKITMAVIFSVTAMVSRDFPSASILVAVQLAVLPLSGLRLRSVLMMGWPLAAAAAMTWFSTAVMADPGGGVVISWGWYTVTEGAAAVAAAVTARMLALALACCSMASMNGYDVGAALARWVRLPQAFVFGALAAMRLFGSLPAVWAMVAMGRRSRGVKPGWASQLVPFLVAVIRQGLRVADSMEALGMKAGNVGRPLRRTWLRPSVFSLRDAIAVVCTGVVCSGAVAFSIAAGLWQPLWG